MSDFESALDLALLREASSLLSASLQPQVVIDRLTQLLAKATGADLVSIFTFDGELARRISVYGPWLQPELLAHYSVGRTVDWRAYESTSQLKRTGKAVSGSINDPNFPPPVRAELDRAGITTYAALPLAYRGEVLGAVYVYTSDGQPHFDSRTMALSQGLADHAALALEHARLHQALREHAAALEEQVATKTATLTQRNRELLMLNEVLVAVNESLDLETMLTSVAERLLQLLDVEQCSLYLTNSDRDEPLIVVTSIADARPCLLRPEQIAHNGELWRRLEASPGILRLPMAELVHGAELEIGDAREVILYPLRAQGDLLGLVLLRCPQEWTLDQDEGFWKTLGDQIGLAVQNAHLHQATQEQAKRLRILLDIGHNLNSSLKLQEVLDRAVIAIRDYVSDVHNCAISLLEDNDRRLRNVSQWSSEERHQIRPLDEHPLVKDLHASRIAVETRRPVTITDLWHDLSILEKDRARLRHTGLRALLYVPILSKEKVWGLIHVNTFEQPRVFAAHELELLQGIAAQLALALENVHLMETARQHADAALARAQELDTFTYTVSHDLKSPLVTLQGYAEVLAEDYAGVLDEQGLYYLKRVSANAQTMAQMIEELLLLSRVDRDERPPEPVDIGQVIEEVLTQLHPTIQAQEIKLTVSHDFPTVAGQAVWLEQVFANLIGNAIKFMGDDNPDPQVEIGWKKQGEEALFWVGDNGIGIASQDHQRIFELFTRLHTVRREGTGLGLAIVRRVVERAGGQIWVESELNKGSRFYFTWPTLL